MQPKCGRLVGFNASHLHGVKAVVRGQRCAIAMWYTFDPSYTELGRVRAQELLDSIDKQSHLEQSGHDEL